ncbi:MAG: tetratricopeptide repeat protein, partial [Pseudomonadota bacterium]
MRRQHSLLLLAITLVVTWFCYSAAFDSAYHLDDEVNLGGLATVSDNKTFADFVMSGTAGPTGRPLSLLTFAWQADEWERGPSAFLAVNTLIHLLNAILLAFCVRAIFLINQLDDRRATLIAVAAASVWVVLPLISSATLLVVQRMTGLSSMFVLLGLAGIKQVNQRVDGEKRAR